jgi:hypothetical protein
MYNLWKEFFQNHSLWKGIKLLLIFMSVNFKKDGLLWDAFHWPLYTIKNFVGEIILVNGQYK